MRCKTCIILLLLCAGPSSTIVAEDPSPQESGCYEFLNRFPNPFPSSQGPYHFHANGFSFLFFEDGRASFAGIHPDGRPWYQPGMWSTRKDTITLKLNYSVDMSYQCERQCTQFDYPSNGYRYNDWKPEYPFSEDFRVEQIARCQKYCYRSVPDTYGKVVTHFPVLLILRLGQGGYPVWLASNSDDPEPVDGKEVVRFPYFTEWTPFTCDYVIVEEKPK